MTHMGHESKHKFSIDENSKDELISSDDEVVQEFTVISTNYKLERKKKLHQESTSKSNFNITAITLDFKGKRGGLEGA